MKNFILKKQEAWRLALAMNNYTDIKEIIARIIIYIIYKNESPMTIMQIVNNIDKEVARFDYNEIEETILYCDKYFMETIVEEDKYYDITGEARIIFENKKESVFDRSIKNFILENSLEFDVQYIKEIIFNYLYKCVEEDYTLLDSSALGNFNYEESSGKNTKEEELINQYIYWAKSKNDDTLIKIVLSLTDFCQLSANASFDTVKKLIGNKNLYLDANVIFRLMGLNNQDRKECIEKFIEKCNYYKIKIFITNFTDNEMRETLKYYSDVIPNNFRNYKGGGEINNFFGIEDNNLNLLYLNNKKNKGVYNNNRFYNDLIDIYEKSIEQFEKVTFPINANKIDNDLRDSYKSMHKNIWDISINTDLFNILSIMKIREQKGDKEIEDYFVTEDKKLVHWTKKNISNFSPLATFPSQWFTLFLKLGQRSISIEEKKAFYNFLIINSSFKMTDVETGDAKKIVASLVNERVDNGILQDRIFKKLQYEESKKLKDMNYINKIIRETTEQYNEEQRQSGYKNGKNDVYNGLIIDKKKKMENLKVKLNKFFDSIPMETNKLRNRNICINIIVFIVFVALFIIFYLLKLEIFIRIMIIVFAIIMQLRLIKLFPFDIKECNDIAENMVKCKKEYIEIQSSIRALEIEIDDLEIKKKDID